MNRVILHCDMNNFYATVEAKKNPELKGKTLAVGGSDKDRHGIVLAKSYEAKLKGVKTGESLFEARRKCPELIVVPPDFDEYLIISKEAREIYYSYTDKVEPYGIDECWLDLSGTRGLFGDPLIVADQIKERIKAELGVTISVGLSFNKIFAKLASDLADRDSVMVIGENDFQEKIWPLPVGDLLGVGYATRKKLDWYGIHTIGDLASTGENFLKRKLGINGERLLAYAKGLDRSPVRGFLDVAPVKSVGHGITLRRDAIDENEVFMVLLELGIDVAYRLSQLGLLAKGVEVGIRDSALRFFSFQGRLPFPASAPLVLADTARRIFQEKYNWDFQVRLVSIRAINLEPVAGSEQLDLLGDFKVKDNQEAIASTLVKVRQRYGKGFLTYGVLLGEHKIPEQRNMVSVLPGAMLR